MSFTENFYRAMLCQWGVEAIMYPFMYGRYVTLRRLTIN